MILLHDEGMDRSDWHKLDFIVQFTPAADSHPHHRAI